jgi:hypothetical protein
VVDQNDYDKADYGQLMQSGLPLGGAIPMLGAVPEPATLGMMALGLAAMALRRRRAAK